MEPKCSLPYWQKPTTCPYPESDRSNLYPPSNFSKIHFNIILLPPTQFLFIYSYVGFNVHYCTVRCLTVICFVPFAVYVLIIRFMFLLFFYLCFLVLYVLFSILCVLRFFFYCFGYWFSSCIYFVFSVCVQVYWQLPSGANPIAVNKYHIPYEGDSKSKLNLPVETLQSTNCGKLRLSQ